MKTETLILLIISSVISADSENWDNWVTPQDYDLFPTLPIAAPLSQDEKCREDSRRLILNLRNKTLWAVQMWDSSSTSAFGILHGNNYQFGNYDECLAVTWPFRVHYCQPKVLATVHQKEAFDGDPYDIDPSPNVTVWKKIEDSRRDLTKYARDESIWGLCVPKSCNATEMEKSINQFFKKLNEDSIKSNGTTFEVEIREDRCFDGTDENFSYGEIGFWFFTWTLLILVGLATGLDVMQQKETSLDEWRGKRLLMFLSLKRNWKRLLVSDESSEGKRLQLLYGIRCTSIVFIVIDHHIAIFLRSAMFNRQRMEEVILSYQNIFLPQGDLVVDTFFFIGGYLVTNSLLTALEKKPINFFFVILSRILRLAPLYFYIVWFQASALLRFGSGPLWKSGLEEEIEFCRKNWWANILFIQNYVNSKEMCMLHAWYLPCDMHFFILCVILVLIINKNKKFGVILLHTVTIISIMLPGIVTYIYELEPIITFSPKFIYTPRSDPSFEYLYIKSHTRATVYLLGIVTAYYIFQWRQSTWKITKRTSVLALLVGLGLLFAPMAYGSLYYNPRKVYNLTESVIFALLRRLSWGLAWVIFMVVNRFGVIPIFGKLFSLKISVPLSKTTYGVYLIHFIMQMADEAKLRIPYQFISFDMFVKGTNDLIFATGYALVLYLIIELPFRLIFRELLFPQKPQKNEKTSNQEEVKEKGNLPFPSVFSVKL